MFGSNSAAGSGLTMPLPRAAIAFSRSANAISSADCGSVLLLKNFISGAPSNSHRHAEAAITPTKVDEFPNNQR
jgi:hypothetical protein